MIAPPTSRRPGSRAPLARLPLDVPPPTSSAVPADLAAWPYWNLAAGKVPVWLDGSNVDGDGDGPGTNLGNVHEAARTGATPPTDLVGTRADALEGARDHRRTDGIGVRLVPTRGRRLVAFDFDGVIDRDGRLHAEVVGILDALGTWCEVSRSGRGVHAFGWADVGDADDPPWPDPWRKVRLDGDPGDGWVPWPDPKRDGATIAPGIEGRDGRQAGYLVSTGTPFGRWGDLPLADVTRPYDAIVRARWVVAMPPPSRAVQGQETRDTGTSVGARPYLTWPTAQALAEALGATATGSGQWHGRCPAHDGTTDRNLHITERPGRPPLVHCFGGGRCSQAAVVDALVARGIVTMSADGGWPLTDAGNATRLVAAHGDDLRWDAPRTRWLAWDGRRWHPVPGEGVAQRARRLVEDATGPAAQAARAEREATGRRGPAARWHGHLLASQGRARIEAAVAIARGDPAVLLDDTARLDDDAGTLVVGDGVVDLRTGEVRPHRRDDLGTRVVLHGDKPAPYVPDAPAPEAWAAYVERAVPDPTVRAWLWVILGAGIVGDGSARRLLVLHGPPASGKGTMVATVLAALGGDDGGYVTTGDPDVLMVSGRDGDGSGHLAGVARWRDRRLVALDETGDGRKVDPGRLKRLLPGAGGAIYARDLYERGSSSRAMAPTWLPILTTNHLPAVGGGDDEAVWDRVAVVPFDRRVEPEERTDLSSRLPRDPAVLAHVLACIVDGARRYLADPRLLAHPPIAVRAAVEAWRGQGDSRARAGDLDGWLRSGGVEVGPNLEAKWVDLRASYDAWCDARRVFAPLTNGAMATALADLPGVKQRRTRTSRVWVGIGLVGDLDDLEGEADGLA